MLKNNRIIYLGNSQSFYDKKLKRHVSREEAGAIIERIYDLEPQAVNGALEMLENSPIPDSAVIKGKGSLRTILDDIYLRFKHDLGLVRSVSNGVAILYSVNNKKEVKYIGGLDEESFRTYIASKAELIQIMRYELNSGDSAAAIGARLDMTSLIKEMYKRFELDHELMISGEPALLSWGDKPAYKVLDSSKIVQGDHPSWDEFLARVDHPETFKAYVWSIFEPTNFGRQALWIQGEGNDGKSSAINAIASFFGREHVFSIGIGSYDRDFFFGEAHGKRLAVYMDCKNLSVLRKERIKSLLGKDTVSINQKYEKAFSSQIYSKLFVLSNWLPQINYNDDSERTRLLLVRVSSYENEYGDPDFQLKLEQELPYFLNSCRESYEDQCPNGMNLKVPEAMQEAIRTFCSATDSELVEQFIEERLEFGQDFYVTKNDLRNDLRSFYAKNWASADYGFSFNDLLRMLGKMQVKQGRLLDTGSKMRVLLGVRLVGTNTSAKNYRLG